MYDFQSARSSRDAKSGEVIFERLIDLSPGDLEDEARDLLIAGSDTTAVTLSNAVYYICSNEAVKERLVTALDEFANAQEGKVTLSSLEKIPYLVSRVAGLKILFSIADPSL